MHFILPHAVALAHLHLSAISAVGGLGRHLAHRLLFRELFRSGGWMLVVAVILALVIVGRFARRR